jgi:hypothetical protein
LAFVTSKLSRFENRGASNNERRDPTLERPKKGKSMKSITAVIAALAILGCVSLGAAEQTCCEKAKAAGKECDHKCCVKAKKEGKTCEKCNPKKEEKK